MKPLPTPEEMAAADAAAIDAGTPAHLLMDRAGRALAREVLRVGGRRYGLNVAVVCGKGSNGGDGFAAARALAREGARPRCLLVGGMDAVSGAAAHHLELLRTEGGVVDPFPEASLERADVIVDALFGTGFRGVAEGEAAAAIDAINAAQRPVVAADIPSGVNGETGAVEGPGVDADVTVAMGAEKIGTAVGRGAALAGRVTVADIGIPVGSVRAGVVEEDDVRRVLPTRAPDAHKRSGGAVAIVAGSDAMTGAVVLTASGAMRMGAGYVTVGASVGAVTAVQGLLPEVLARVVGEGDHLDAASADRFVDVLERADSLAVGPGLGRGQDQHALVERLLTDVEKPIVLDADGLNVLEGNTGALARRDARTVLTPHAAELARLLGTDVEKIQADRVASARRAAEEFGCAVLLKGFRTVVAQPDQNVVVNPTGGPELATAGTGDVLTGAVSALLAAGVEDFEAAWASAYVHGLAGSLARAQIGAAGVIAGDVADALPDALKFLTDQPRGNGVPAVG